MAIAQYIEVNLVLDSFDLIQIETLIERRITELKEFKAQYETGSIHAMLADEQLYNYGVTQRRIKNARKEVKRVKAESDAAFAAQRAARKNGARR